MQLTDFIATYGVDRSHTNSVKWDGVSQTFHEKDALPLWVADMDFKAPQAVLDALTKRVQHGAFGYSLPADSYYDAYFNWQKTRYGVTLKKEWVRFGLGVVNALSNLVNALTEPGDAVLVQQPVYYPFMDVIKHSHRKLVVSPLVATADGYRMDLANLEEQFVANNVRVMFLCSPHNPVGRVWTADELNEVFELARKHHVLVFADEIHHDLLVNATKFTPALSLNDGKYRDNVITLDSPSKTFNLAALHHCNIIIANPQLRRQYDLYVGQNALPQMDLLGQVAAEAAYRDGAEWLQNVLAVIKQNYELVKQTLADNLPQARVADLQGTYLAWVDLSAYVPADQIEQVIVHQAKLAVDLGDWFGRGGAGHIRLNLAAKPATVKQALNQLVTTLKK